MQIEIDIGLDELSDNHPIRDVLNVSEKALYLSAIHNAAEAAENIKENSETDKDQVDIESPVQTENTNQLRLAITLGELIEEVAAGRQQVFSKESLNTPTEER